MAILLVIAGAAALWAWRTGRLKNYTYEDGVAAVLFLLGLRLMTTGRILMGAALMSGSLFWAAWRRGRVARQTMSPMDARRLLGVGLAATPDEIRAAHRRLIARVHPDVGGSAELAHRVNVARDVLLAQANLPEPR